MHHLKISIISPLIYENEKPWICCKPILIYKINIFFYHQEDFFPSLPCPWRVLIRRLICAFRTWLLAPPAIPANGSLLASNFFLTDINCLQASGISASLSTRRRQDSSVGLSVNKKWNQAMAQQTLGTYTYKEQTMKS